MADEGPPKPKPGSLKDRIKQFEASSSTSSSGSTPPPPRPKPGTLGQWKPKPLDPPSPNKQTNFPQSPQDTSHTSGEHAPSSAMSAEDAMSSISKGGGTLKERMAALQGKGAFGDTSSSTAPPLPSSEGKPRVWRTSPAPLVEPKKPEEGTEHTAERYEDISRERSPIEPSPISPSGESKGIGAYEGAAGETAEPGDEGEEKPEEEQERERRATIAARMARLGGARLGMPIGFGIAAKGLQKPAIPAKPRILTSGDASPAGSSAPTSALSPIPPSADGSEKLKPVRQTTLETATKVPLPKSEGSLLTLGSMDSAEMPSDSDATASGKLVPPRSPAIPKTPDSMPIPALPKRASGPRRKKSAKEMKPTTGSTGEVESPPILSSGPSQAVTEVQAAIPAQVKTPVGEEVKPMLNPEPDQSTSSLTEEPASALDDLVSAEPSEIATPPPPSPSVLATEDEDEGGTSGGPSRRPTIEVSAGEEKTIEEEGSQLLTPRPRSESSEEAGDVSLSTALGRMMQAGPKIVEGKPTKIPAGEYDVEEDEEARKRRVAEKMARLGAVNPFSPGNITSPISSHNDKQGGDTKREEPEEASGQASVTESTANNDSNVDLAAHESESNVPFLPLSHSRISQDVRDEETDPLADTQIATEGDTSQDNLGVDVEYPMMSPVTGGNHEMQTFSALHDLGGETASRNTTAVESTPQYDDEREYSDDDNDRAEAETIHDQRNATGIMPPLHRSSRGAPPLSPVLSSPSPSMSPTTDQFDQSSPRAALAAALARRAPPPPPGHQLSVSPPTDSASPTPSPPPRPFVREGAPSPPSLEGSFNMGDQEEFYEEEEAEEEEEEEGEEGEEEEGEEEEGDEREEREEEEEYFEDNAAEEQEEAQGIPTEEPPAAEEKRKMRPPSLPKVSPPPLPGGRPPLPSVRRSIPPPPRHALPPTPYMEASTRPPPPAPKQSIMVIPISPSESVGREVDYDILSGDEDSRAMREASERPALPPPSRKESAHQRTSGGREVMEDEEGDPKFIGNRQLPFDTGATPSRGHENTIAHVEKEMPPPEGDPEDDPEALRRRTIAERMAKLGGVKFGMMPMTSRPPPVHKISEPNEEDEQEASTTKRDPDGEGDSNQSPEEIERARRAGIAARMAAMGGRGFGMYGTGVMPPAVPDVSSKVVPTPSSGQAPTASLASPPPIPGARPKRESRDGVSHAITRPPPPIPANDSGAGETWESEVEVVDEDIEEDGEMVEQVEDEEPELVDRPPALPSRSGRPPILPASRPPPPLPSSAVTSPPLSTRNPSYPSTSPQHDYEVVGTDIQRHAPAARIGHSRSTPASNAESSAPPSLESSGQWELPNIPSGSFDLGQFGKPTDMMAGTINAENDASWTKVDQHEPVSRAPAPVSRQVPGEPFTGPPPPIISNEALNNLAHRMGPVIVSSAQHIYEKSKRTVIGDGSSASFLFTVLSLVAGASTSNLGHLVYAQTGGSVQKRLGDVMPGDVVALYEAHFKGHKGGLGLGAYNVSWGTKTHPVLGIVIEFEGKKNKIRAFAVNQHPNSYPTIDTPSYKLDDLKGGTLKVFRVAETS